MKWIIEAMMREAGRGWCGLVAACLVGLMGLAGCATMSVQGSDELQALDDACGQGDGEACFDLGLWYYEDEEASEEELRLALVLFDRACELGFAEGCAEVGVAYEEGIGVEADQEVANDWYFTACEMDSARGCLLLGFSYFHGRAVEQDYEEASLWFETGCALGNGEACTNLGWMYESGNGREIDFDGALDLYWQGCEAGHARGCGNLGLAHEYGRGFDTSPELAAEAHELGCESGWMRSCFRLGLQAWEGRGVEEDQGVGMELFEFACDGEYGEACVLLGELYAEGEGVDQDRDRARDYAERGCELDVAAGCILLGELTESGAGAHSFRRACELSADTCIQAARRLVERGDNDALLAAELLEKGCEEGSYSSCMGRIAIRHPALEARFAEGCEQGVGVDCLHLSKVRGEAEEFDGVCQEETREVMAEEDAEAACDEGSWEGCWLRGAYLIDEAIAWEAPRSGPQAMEDRNETVEAELRGSCEGGDAGDCLELARMLREHERDESMAFFEAACDGEVENGCWELAVHRAVDPDSEVAEAGFAHLESLCEEEGIVRACLDQGEALRERSEKFGDELDHERVASLKQRACRDGDTRACWRLRVYFERRGGDLHSRACSFHYGHTQCRLDNWSGCWRYSEVDED